MNPRYRLDTECYRDYFLLMMRDRDTGETLGAEMYPGKPLGVSSLPPGTFVTFNGKNYDFPILSLALAGCDNATLKAASDDIIVNGLKPWHIADKYGGVDLSGVDHIDLIEVAPGQCGLKAYGGRMHSARLQDLPIDPAASIGPTQRPVLVAYCGNDLETTGNLDDELTPQLQLREQMSEEYGIDLRSKSDAQIAEAVIRSEVEKLRGERVWRPDIHPAYTFQYRPPAFLSFQTPGMQQVLSLLQRATFTLDVNGKPEIPQELESMRIRIGNGVYRMGNGGLHSSETCISYTEPLEDWDVTGYYPAIILTQQLAPAHLGAEFLQVFQSIVDRRIAAKRMGDTVVADSLKIVVNGSFGKLGSKWSTLYSPDLLIQVTLTGQLALLMLIEMLELNGVTVVSANTDGVVMKSHPNIEPIVHLWELLSGLQMEQTQYRALHAKDVNNYIAIKENGGVKLKGIYSQGRLNKNPTNAVCIDAVLAYVQHGIPLEDTINGCGDIRKFLTIRQVKGGGSYDGVYLGKAVRWYYATDEDRCIRYASNGNKVAKSDGARPAMELPASIPADLDYAWYTREAKSILGDIGL
jgi:hypothetical protein